MTLPLYSYADVDYLADVSRGTARRWLAGYEYKSDGRGLIALPAVTHRQDPEDAAASFVDLIEVIAIGALKQAGFSLPTIRRIVHTCQEMLGVPRPLVTLQFKIGGKDIFVDHGDALLEVGRKKGNQAWHEFLSPFLKTLDYTTDAGLTPQVARRWWPMGREVPIVVDPAFGFGRPAIGQTGVRTAIILEHFRAKETVDEIAQDFDVSPMEVQRALQFELDRAA